MGTDLEGRKILIVDDDPINLMVLSGHLKNMGHHPVEAESAPVALKLLDGSFDLILSDVIMPEMDGFELVRAVRSRIEFDDIPIIMVTTLADKSARLEAVEAGANDFINKPLDVAELRIRTRSLLEMKRKNDEIRQFHAELNTLVEQRTMALKSALGQLKEANVELIHRLATAAEFRDNETAAHIRRMSHYCALLAEKLGMDTAEVEMILHASPMHDIGKIGIPDAVLLKPGKLDAQEWEMMRKHTEFGGTILNGSQSTWIQAGEVIALSHHEKWDGSGYPKGLSGVDIPLYGRICAVADVFDALTSERPYKAAFPLDKSLKIMREGAGAHFDPHLLQLFLDNMEEVLAIKDKYAD